MVWLILEGFINFYNKRNGQKLAKSSKNHRGPCKQGCLRCPLGSRPGLQGYFENTGACRTGGFKCPGDNKGFRAVGIMIYNNSYRNNPSTKGPDGGQGWLEELL